MKRGREIQHSVHVPEFSPRSRTLRTGLLASLRRTERSDATNGAPNGTTIGARSFYYLLLFLRSLLVTIYTSKALVTTSVALVSNSFLLLLEAMHLLLLANKGAAVPRQASV